MKTNFSMNSQYKKDTEESPYKPSARPSIHQHNYCIFSDRDNMGRYGIKENQVANTPEPCSHNQGTDEVDNVMSKFTRQTSPVPVKQNKSKRRNRRNSLSVSNPECTDDDDSDSDDFAHISVPSDFLNINNSTSFTETRSRTQIHRNNTYDSHNEFDSQNENSQVRQSTSKRVLPVKLVLVGVLCAIAAIYYNDIIKFFEGRNSIIINNQLNLKKEMHYLGEKYKINDNSILEVQSGISTILERNDTGSFIFVYNDRSVEFIKFVEDIAATAVRYLRNDSTSVQPTIIHSSKLNMQSHSDLMNEYRHEVARTGVMLVKDIDKIPSRLAMAFHYFCDEYNPLVAKSAIFFTLNLEKCSNIAEQKSTHNEIEKCLEEKWSSVPKDNIKPLLSRVVSVVIDVTDV